MPYHHGMSKRHKITAELDPQMLVDLERLCVHLGASREQLVTNAILRFVQEELRHLPGDSTDCADLPPYVETDPLAAALNDAEGNAAEALRAYLKPAEDDIQAGRLIDHEDFMREMRERYRSRDAA
jgi:hypothetical protein